MDDCIYTVNQEFLKPAEACSYLGISATTLKRWRHSNRLIKGIHYTQYGPKTIRYDATWLEKFRRSGGRGHHKMEVADEITTLKRSHSSQAH